MKKVLLAVLAIAMSLGAVAQVKARWGSIDVRYPMDCAAAARDEAVNHAVAWRGERVNLQLLVENGAKECSVEYTFSDLKNGRSVIPAANVVGGFVQPVLTDKFTGCGKHAVDAHGEVLAPDRITDTNPTVLDAGSCRGLWLTIQVPQDAEPGTYKGYVELVCNGKKKKYDPYKYSRQYEGRMVQDIPIYCKKINNTGYCRYCGRPLKNHGSINQEPNRQNHRNKVHSFHFLHHLLGLQLLHLYQ